MSKPKYYVGMPVGAIPKTPYPWRVVEHEKTEYLVRIMPGCCWVQRLPDYAVWFYEPESAAPAWVRLPIAQMGLPL